jgi:homoserine O-acetyltransferase/O-succinyltransferase
VIVVLGGISATRHVTSTAENAASGWWEPIVGQRRAIDTSIFRVLSFEYLDGGEAPDGRPLRLVSTDDQADALASLLDALAIERIHTFVGASYGGMVALAFAARYPELVEQLVVISAPHESHPLSTAVRSVQRRVVELGLETGKPDEALALARALAMTTYRSAREFADRFDSTPSIHGGRDATFPVERYLRHHGEKFASRWRPSRYLALSLSGDLHAVDPRQIRTPSVLVAAEGDLIVPAEQMEQLAERLAGPARLVCLPTIHGHDAFLTEPARVGRILTDALTSDQQ